MQTVVSTSLARPSMIFMVCLVAMWAMRQQLATAREHGAGLADDTLHGAAVAKSRP
jgi:hypothetical protein